MDSATECRYIVPIRIQENSQNASRITSPPVMISRPLVLEYLIRELDPAEESEPFHCLGVVSLHPVGKRVGGVREAPPEAVDDSEQGRVAADPSDDPTDAAKARRCSVNELSPLKLREEAEGPRIRSDDFSKVRRSVNGSAAEQLKRKVFVPTLEWASLASGPKDLDASDFA